MQPSPLKRGWGLRATLIVRESVHHEHPQGRFGDVPELAEAPTPQVALVVGNHAACPNGGVLKKTKDKKDIKVTMGLSFVVVVKTH